MLFFIDDQVLQNKVLIKHCPTLTMRADFFTKPIQGMLFYRLCDLIMNIASESPYHSSHRSVLKDTGEGHNEYNDNPAQETETSSGAYTTACNASISPDLTNNSTRDRVSCDIYTKPPSSLNLN